MGSLMKRGGVYFGCLRDLDGKKVRYSTKQRNMLKAGNILAEWERRVAAGLPARPDEEERRVAADARKRRDASKGLTVHALCEMYMDPKDGYRRPRIKSMRGYWRVYGSYVRTGIQAAPIASLPAATLRKADVEKWRDDFLAVNFAPSTCRNMLVLLGTIYGWAIDTREMFNIRNPVRGVEHLPVTERGKGLDLAQAQRLLQRPAPEVLRVQVLTALLAGLRAGELRGLRRTADLFLDAPTPHLVVNRSYRTTPKGGRPRVVPLHPLLVDELRAYLKQAPPAEDCEDLVFPCPSFGPGGRPDGYRMAREADDFDIGKLYKAADVPLPREAKRRGKVEGNARAWHALRHAFASRCRDCGIPRDAIADLLGHRAAGPAVTGTYLHDSPETLARLAAELRRLWYLEPALAAPQDPPAAPAAAPAPAPAPPPPAPALAAPAAPPTPAADPGAEIIDFAAARAARSARRAG